MGSRLSPGREEASRGGGSGQAGAGRAEGGLQILVVPWPALCRCCLGRPAPHRPPQRPPSAPTEPPIPPAAPCKMSLGALEHSGLLFQRQLKKIGKCSGCLSPVLPSQNSTCVFETLGPSRGGKVGQTKRNRREKSQRAVIRPPQEDDEKGQPLPQPPVTDLKLQ